MLQFAIKNQTIKRTDNYRPVAGQPITCHFTFTDDWQNLTKKAVFRTSGSDTPHIQDLYITDSCDIPTDLLTGTELRVLTVSILGSGTDSNGKHICITSSSADVLVYPYAYGDSNNG